VECAPVLGWSKERAAAVSGSHHVSYRGFASEVRLTTDAPLSYLGGEPFALTERKHFVFTWGAPVEEPLVPLCDRFFRATLTYWRTWVKHCDIPAEYQAEVIRSALALKLHCFEDTGAIIASPTTSIPEAEATERTWDYRYCWLRDAYYALGAFRLLGHFEEREQFIHYLLNVASSAPGLDLRPLYRIDGKADLEERRLEGWAGYLGHRPVRVGNGAATHAQHDVFGEMVLALAPLFLDARFRDRATEEVLKLLCGLADRAIAVAGTPDAGIWEYRTEWKPQTFSSLMCWAGLDRMARVAQATSPDLRETYASSAARIRETILSSCVDPSRATLVDTPGGREVDASLLQAITLGLVSVDDPRANGTIDAVVGDLDSGGLLRRYRGDDGFGAPKVAFTLCSFWLVEALCRVSRLSEARALMKRVLQVPSPLGLLSEDVDPKTNVMWGNFPQAYSHVGLIHAAFAASPDWRDVG
jgi:GH15 family glucan-1,4-alpha-glucosidase